MVKELAPLGAIALPTLGRRPSLAREGTRDELVRRERRERELRRAHARKSRGAGADSSEDEEDDGEDDDEDDADDGGADEDEDGEGGGAVMSDDDDGPVSHRKGQEGDDGVAREVRDAQKMMQAGPETAAEEGDVAEQRL